MKTKVGVAGCNGNMGRRYVAILKHLGIEYHGWDYADYMPHELQFNSKLDDCTHFIIATPSINHIENIRYLASFDRPILCEKPIALEKKDLLELEVIYEKHRELKLLMVNNYYYAYRHSGGKNRFHETTSYDYYNTGGDGLALDCIQLLRYANGRIIIKNTSPRWQCEINGVKIERASIDDSYIAMINDFIKTSDYYPDKKNGYKEEKKQIFDCHKLAFKLKHFNSIELPSKKAVPLQEKKKK